MTARTSPETATAVLERIKAGDILSQICRATDTSPWTVYKVARLNGLQIAKPTNAQMATWGKLGPKAQGKEKVIQAPVMTPQQYWKGMKASLRNGWGGGW